MTTVDTAAIRKKAEDYLDFAYTDCPSEIWEVLSAAPAMCDELDQANAAIAELELNVTFLSSKLEELVRAESKMLEQVMDERDSCEFAIQAAHVELGGDGEWAGKLPPQNPPNSGDLRLDVVALAMALKAENERLRKVMRVADEC